MNIGTTLPRTLPGLLACLAVMHVASVHAQTPSADAPGDRSGDRYPNRPIRLIVPYPPGAANDTLARSLAQRIAPALGQSVVVENKPGAGGHLGAEIVARAAPDGYTLLIGTAGLIAIGPHLFRKLPYDAQRDLVPVTRFATVPYVFGVPATLGLRGAKDLVALARSRPGGLNFASSGNGSMPHLCGALFNLRTGIKMAHVPYEGDTQALNDVVTGQPHVYCGGIPSLLGHVQAGRIKLVGVTSGKRSLLLPDEPTLAEQGIPGVEVSSWLGLFAPAATPAPIVRRLIAEIERVMATSEMKQHTLAQGAEPEAVSGAAFADDLAVESMRWSAVVRASGATVD